jgi:hypothetical protein
MQKWFWQMVMQSATYAARITTNDLKAMKSNWQAGGQQLTFGDWLKARGLNTTESSQDKYAGPKNTGLMTQYWHEVYDPAVFAQDRLQYGLTPDQARMFAYMGDSRANWDNYGRRINDPEFPAAYNKPPLDDGTPGTPGITPQGTPTPPANANANQVFQGWPQGAAIQNAPGDITIT